MTINEAINSVISQINLNLQSEFVNLNSAKGKILASDFKALRNSPVFDNSALDGYAYDANFKDEFLQVIKPTIFAGCKEIYEIKPNEAQKIMTGAPFPKGANSVIRLEDAEFENEKLKMPKEIKFGDGHRKAGEEFKLGEVLIKKGETLTPNKILLLASMGANKIEVFKKPKIAIFSSGNELINLEDKNAKADEFAIYDANSFGISALLLQNGFECENLGIIKDDFDLTLKTLEVAIKNYDIIITSGGASVGEADFLQKALNELKFTQILNGISVKPGGKPTKCFKSGNTLVFVLPGNPLPAYGLSLLFVLPILRYLSGALQFENQKVLAKFSTSVKLNPKRQDMVFGEYKNGEFTPYPSKFSSYMISILSNSTHIFVNELGVSEVAKGEFCEIFGAY